MNKYIGPLTWAYVIIIGGLMITPGGIVPIVTNPATRIAVGSISVLLGILGFLSLRQRSEKTVSG